MRLGLHLHGHEPCQWPECSLPAATADFTMRGIAYRVHLCPDHMAEYDHDVRSFTRIATLTSGVRAVPADPVLQPSAAELEASAQEERMDRVSSLLSYYQPKVERTS